MIRTTCLICFCVLAFNSPVNGEFLIDHFANRDSNSALGSSVSTVTGLSGPVLTHSAIGGSIFVDMYSTGSVSVSTAIPGGYFVTNASNGDTFGLRYTWTTNGTYLGGATFDALQSISGLKIGPGDNASSVKGPIPNDFGLTAGVGWTLDVTTGSASSYSGSPSFNGIVELDDATFIDIKFTYSDGGISGTPRNDGSIGFGQGAFVATPEPTTAVMFGVVGLIAACRRRRI